MRKISKKIATFVAAIATTACIAVSSSAYSDMGDSVHYTVKNTSTTWDNKNSTYAWNLNASEDCKFYGDVSSGCVASFKLYQWTLGEVEVSKADNVVSYFAKYIYANKVPVDDYFTRVTYNSGGTINGDVTFEKY